MLAEIDWVKRIKLGYPVPGSKIVERRSNGLHTIRQEFLAQLLRTAPDSLSTSLAVRWHRQSDLVNSRTVLDDAFALVFVGTAHRVRGLFPDLWILCYPEDPEVKQKVNEEITRMCQEAVGTLRPGEAP